MSLYSMKPLQKAALCAAMAIVGGVRIASADYEIDWYAISGGGGASTGGPYQVSGTIGQPAADAMGGGPYTVQGGFWSLVAVVQTPGAPLLRIAVTATNSVVLSWPAGPAEFRVQQNSDLSSTNWVGVGQAPVLVGGESQVIVPPPAGNRFYRLKWP